MTDLFKPEKKKKSELWKDVDRKVKALDQDTMKQYLTVFIVGLMVIVILVFLLKKWIF